MPKARVCMASPHRKTNPGNPSGHQASTTCHRNRTRLRAVPLIRTGIRAGIRPSPSGGRRGTNEVTGGAPARIREALARSTPATTAGKRRCRTRHPGRASIRLPFRRRSPARATHACATCRWRAPGATGVRRPPLGRGAPPWQPTPGACAPSLVFRPGMGVLASSLLLVHALVGFRGSRGSRWRLWPGRE
jgi:hypothetical protein